MCCKTAYCASLGIDFSETVCRVYFWSVWNSRWDTNPQSASQSVLAVGKIIPKFRSKIDGYYYAMLIYVHVTLYANKISCPCFVPKFPVKHTRESHLTGTAEKTKERRSQFLGNRPATNNHPWTGNQRAEIKYQFGSDYFRRGFQNMFLNRGLEYPLRIGFLSSSEPVFDVLLTICGSRSVSDDVILSLYKWNVCCLP